MNSQNTFHFSIILILVSLYCVDGDTFNDNLTDFFACNSNIVYAVGDKGSIIKTTDGGLSWRAIKTPESTYFSSVFFVSEDTGWVAGYDDFIPFDGKIIYTTDGGENWINQNSNADFLTSIYFVNKYKGWIVGHGKIFHTDDGGKVWIPKDSSGYFNSIYFFDENLGFAIGGRTILRTSNGGSTWIKIDSGFDVSLKSICFTSAKKGFTVGSISHFLGPRSVMLMTIDSGKTWSNVGGVGDGYKSISFGDTSTGYVYGEYLTLLKTDDGGNNWHNIYYNSPIKLPRSINTVKFIDKNIGWAVGGGTNKILKTTDGGNNWEYQSNIITSTSNLANFKPYTSHLIGNFPNPFNVTTTIKFLLHQSGQVKINIYDINGKRVTDLINKYMTQGQHSIKWDAKGASSGIYFYQLVHNGKVIDTKRLLLLK